MPRRAVKLDNPAPYRWCIIGATNDIVRKLISDSANDMEVTSHLIADHTDTIREIYAGTKGCDGRIVAIEQSILACGHWCKPCP